MKRTKENIVFNVNNLLLSAFADNSELTKLLKEENDSNKSYVDNDLVSQYENIISGDKSCIDKLVSEEYQYKLDSKAQMFGVFANELKKSPDDIKIIKNISQILNTMQASHVVVKHFEKILLSQEGQDKNITEILADAYFWTPENYSKSIKMYEKLVNKYKLKRYDYYYKLAFLYERVYQDIEIDKEIEYALKASNLAKNNNMVNMFLAKLYYRKGLNGECEKYSKMVLKNNPLPEQIVTYSKFLMQKGKLKESFDLYRCRFKTNNVAYPKALTDAKRWDGKKDLSDATVIIHYEQGFGDSVMFSRYIPLIAAMAKKVILVVQKSIIPVLKSSGLDKYCEILSHEADIGENIKLDKINASVMYSEGTGMSKIPHDYHIPMLDLPYLIGESPDRMKEGSGYLMADKNRIKDFKNKYVKDNKRIKMGIAYRGSKESEVTYRDITLKEFLPLLDLDNVDLYIFQADLKEEELKGINNTHLIDISDYFKDFGDTAAAISAMDLIISTDNVVMNLAGALAVKTYGLFNIYPESRWYKTEGDDIGWYKSVRPFQVKTFNAWEDVIKKIKKQIQKDF